jgi:fatty acid desaturase
MNPRRPIQALDLAFVVAFVLIGFLAFFIGFLVAPLIVMALAYLLLLVLDRRHHQTRLRRPPAAGEPEPGEDAPANSGEPQRERPFARRERAIAAERPTATVSDQRKTEDS